MTRITALSGIIHIAPESSQAHEGSLIVDTRARHIREDQFDPAAIGRNVIRHDTLLKGFRKMIHRRYWTIRDRQKNAKTTQDYKTSAEEMEDMHWALDSWRFSRHYGTINNCWSSEQRMPKPHEAEVGALMTYVQCYDHLVDFSKPWQKVHLMYSTEYEYDKFIVEGSVE